MRQTCGFSHRAGKMKYILSDCSLLLAALVFVVLLVGLVFGWKRHVSAPELAGHVKARIANHEYVFELADTPAKRQQGLSNRPILSPQEGMLFIFPEPDKACFWMKDMKFNLDILWFDSSKKLVYEQQNLSPDTYPQSFCPPSNSSYVLEVNAGTIAKLKLKEGDQLQL